MEGRIRRCIQKKKNRSLSGRKAAGLDEETNLVARAGKRNFDPLNIFAQGFDALEMSRERGRYGGCKRVATDKRGGRGPGQRRADFFFLKRACGSRTGKNL